MTDEQQNQQQPLARFSPYISKKKQINKKGSIQSFPVNFNRGTEQKTKSRDDTNSKMVQQKRKRSTVTLDNSSNTFIPNIRPTQSMGIKADDFDVYIEDKTSDVVREDISLPLVPEPIEKSIVELLEADEDDKIVIFQIPSEFPVDKPENDTKVSDNPLTDLSDGCIGTIQIRESGKVTAKIGKATFELKSGIGCSCRQVLCSPSGNGIQWVPICSDKIVMSLDVDQMINDIQHEDDE